MAESKVDQQDMDCSRISSSTTNSITLSPASSTKTQSLNNGCEVESLEAMAAKKAAGQVVVAANGLPSTLTSPSAVDPNDEKYLVHRLVFDNECKKLYSILKAA